MEKEKFEWKLGKTDLNRRQGGEEVICIYGEGMPDRIHEVWICMYSHTTHPYAHLTQSRCSLNAYWRVVSTHGHTPPTHMHTHTYTFVHMIMGNGKTKHLDLSLP